MKHNITAPDSAAIETLIAAAFEETPAPDPVRMQAIRDALAHAKSGSRSHKKPNTLPWWAVLLVTGGLAVAAGWLVNKFGIADKPEQAQVEQPADTLPVMPRMNRHLERSGQPDQSLQQQDPVIYLREAD